MNVPCFDCAVCRRTAYNWCLLPNIWAAVISNQVCKTNNPAYAITEKLVKTKLTEQNLKQLLILLIPALQLYVCRALEDSDGITCLYGLVGFCTCSLHMICPFSSSSPGENGAGNKPSMSASPCPREDGKHCRNSISADTFSYTRIFFKCRIRKSWKSSDHGVKHKIKSNINIIRYIHFACADNYCNFTV